MSFYVIKQHILNIMHAVYTILYTVKMFKRLDTILNINVSNLGECLKPVQLLIEHKHHVFPKTNI